VILVKSRLNSGGGASAGRGSQNRIAGGGLLQKGMVLERVAIFVDVQNIYYTVRQIYHCHFNYRAFWSRAAANRQVVTAVAYAIDRGDEQQRQFQRVLANMGFEVKLKPFIQRRDGSAKGDWDVGITVDIMELAGQVDVVVLASGDGDFDLLVQKIRDKYGVEVEVYGVQDLTAASLIQSATRFIPIGDSLLLAR